MSAPSGSGRRVAILGIDDLARKNRKQLVWMNARGYAFDVFTSDVLGDSAQNLPPGNQLERLEPGATARLRQISAYLAGHRRVLNHVEVYPGGRFAAVYVALARLWRIPTMVVERGDLLYRDRYDRVTRASMALCYRGANVVWYREIYTERLLRKMGVHRRFFLSNAVALPERVPAPSGPIIDFLWVNRLIVERRADWVAEVLARPRLAAARVLMQGFMDGPLASAAVRERQEYVRGRRLQNLEIRPYADPGERYRSSRFFLLPSEIVFGNNALLEAMAHGVVPLVSDVEGARLVVTDGVDGILHPHTREGLAVAMERAMALPPDVYARMSRAAVEKVATCFSMDRWAESLAEQYRRLAAGKPPQMREIPGRADRASP
jgi:glycosyltransferase involved in cell wall biosynthesis